VTLLFAYEKVAFSTNIAPSTTAKSQFHYNPSKITYAALVRLPGAVKRLFAHDPAQHHFTGHRKRNIMTSEIQPCSGLYHRPSLETLPTELLHMIFGQLSLQDVREARKTSRLLATIGVDHLGDEISLVHHRDHFRTLREIAEHPRISKRIRSLYYVYERCIWRPYEEWDRERLDPQDWMKLTSKNPDTGTRSKIDEEALHAESKVRIAAVPESDRQKGYKAFEALCRDSNEIQKTGYDLDCLYSLFKACPNLREVTIAGRNGVHGPLLAAFSDGMTLPDEADSKGLDKINAGKHQVLTVAIAVHRAGGTLDSLTFEEVSPKIFDVCDSALRALVRPLRRLLMLLNPFEEFDGRNVEVPGGADIAVRRNNLRTLLAEARNLCVLWLELPENYLLARDNWIGARTPNAVADVAYQHLYELRMSFTDLDAEVLIGLILRHRATLRRLILLDLGFATDGPTTWRTVLTRISCQLPNLHVCKLSGTFYANANEEFDLDSDPRTTYSYRDALEKFVLSGGEWPKMFSPVPRTAREDLLPVISDDYMELDDPARDYEPVSWYDY
jgi:hypothetical protein